jgi:cytochrome-b5 reductase
MYHNSAPSAVLQRLKVVHVVGNKPDDAAPPGWESTPTYTAETGWIDEAKIAKYAFPPAEDTLLFVCGLPPMYRCARSLPT